MKGLIEEGGFRNAPQNPTGKSGWRRGIRRFFRRESWEFPKHGWVWLILFFALFPLYMILNISLKSNRQFFNEPWFPTPPFHFENWIFGWDQIGGSVYVSIFISFTTTSLVLLMALASAYFFSRYALPGKNVFWALLLMLMFIPGVVNLVPLFTLLRSLHLLNTFTGVIIPATAGGQVVAVYLLRGFIEDIPDDLFDAAQIDGAGDLRQIIHIVVPLCLPILVTIGILQFINSWNDFVIPLIVLRDEALLPIGVKLYQLDGLYIKEWGPMMATYFIAAIPLIIIFFFGMRVFVKGVGTGAIKG